MNMKEAIELRLKEIDKYFVENQIIVNKIKELNKEKDKLLDSLEKIEKENMSFEDRFVDFYNEGIDYNDTRNEMWVCHFNEEAPIFSKWFLPEGTFDRYASYDIDRFADVFENIFEPYVLDNIKYKIRDIIYCNCIVSDDMKSNLHKLRPKHKLELSYALDMFIENFTENIEPSCFEDITLAIDDGNKEILINKILEEAIKIIYDACGELMNKNIKRIKYDW